MSQIDSVLSALVHPVRRSALQLLADGREFCLCELIDRLGVSQPSMSRHMASLRAAGIVLDRREAQWVRYRLNPRLPVDLAHIVEAVLAAHNATRSAAA